MKKIISFERKVEFQSMIGEITSISLDEDLKFTDNSTIKGNLIVKGTYKITEASRLEENFEYELPTEIILTENLEISTAKIDIADFYYEIEEDNILNCHVDISIEAMEVVDYEEEINIPLVEENKQVEELRECDGDPIKEEMEEEPVQIEDTINEVTEEENDNNKVEEEDNNVGSLFTSLNDSEETFSTYSIYIIREETSIESIMEKYSITKEELENYNDLSSIGIGSKVIIPIKNDSV